MALKDAFEKLRDGLQDLSSLEVRTFSGDITAEVQSHTGDLDVGAIVDDGIKNGSVRLKLFTRLDADGDSDHFFDSGDIDPALLQSHVDAFRMGQEIRHGYLELFKEFAEGIIKIKTN